MATAPIADPLGEHAERVLHFWPLLAALGAMIVAAWRSLVVRPSVRLSAVEDKVDHVVDGMNELRIAQARMSDRHAEEIKVLSERIDLTLNMLVGQHMHRRHDDP